MKNWNWKDEYTPSYEIERDRWGQVYLAWCILESSNSGNLINIKCVGLSEEEALSKAILVAERINKLKNNGILLKYPDIDKQPYTNGYYHIQIKELGWNAEKFETKISFKKSGDGGYWVNDISYMDSNNLLIINEPYDVDFSKYKKVFRIRKFSDIPEHSIKEYDYDRINSMLEIGEELWWWDDLGFLSGAAGLMVLKDSKVIKIKGLWLS